MTTKAPAHALLALLAASLFSACGGGSGGSKDPVTGPPPPVPPPAPTVSALEIAPASPVLRPGESIRLSVTATYSDGSSQADPAGITWTSASASVASVDSDGVLTAHEPGGTVATARAGNGVEAHADVEVESPPPPAAQGLAVVPDSVWDETAVRKVLDAFAYGGLASDAQITAWAAAGPQAAIVEMLSFDYTNDRLSPSQDGSSAHAGSLASLQDFWGSATADNPMRPDKRRFYATLEQNPDGSPLGVGSINLQRAWIQATSTRGVNPFLHRVAFYLTNYQMAIQASQATTGLTRAYYDQILADLVAGLPFDAVITRAAQSAAVAMRYGHRQNVFNPITGDFQGNDDFAREYFQLFFRLLGTTEDTAYHEGVTIEHAAMLLTGMEIDRQPGAYGSPRPQDQLVAPIRFTDHVDGSGRYLRNEYFHHTPCLEILRQPICGNSAAAKLGMLGPIVAAHPEVEANLPVYIVAHFADDQLTDEKIQRLRASWQESRGDLLWFLRRYAISTSFHDPTTVKYASAFDRTFTLRNKMILDNREAFLGDTIEDGLNPLREKGAFVFEPVHDVFGGQTGAEAALSTSIFRSAYRDSLDTTRGLTRLSFTYSAADGATRSWSKDWTIVLPPAIACSLSAGVAGDWLWQRLVSDGGKNFDVVARSQVQSLLATGQDFGYAVTQLAPAVSTDAERVYGSQELVADARLAALLADLAGRPVALCGGDPSSRKEANRRMNLAAGFIAMTPYTFAREGR